MATVEAATNLYPKILFLEKTGITSEIIPNAGNAKMYTSGCPNDQKKCCHNMAEPPEEGIKKCASNCLSISIIKRPAFNRGKAANIKNPLINIIQANSGSIFSLISGERRVKIVVTKLRPAPILPIPVRISPTK